MTGLLVSDWTNDKPGHWPAKDRQPRLGLPRRGQWRPGLLPEERLGLAPPATREAGGGTSEAPSLAETIRRSSCNGSFSGSAS